MEASVVLILIVVEERIGYTVIPVEQEEQEVVLILIVVEERIGCNSVNSSLSTLEKGLNPYCSGRKNRILAIK